MDARTYLDTHKDAGAQALIARVRELGGECSLGYFRQIAYGYRRPKVELAELLVAASKDVAIAQGHQDELDVMSLLKAREIHAARIAATAKPEESDHAAP